jgi:RNA polymerase sigma-70 factor (ECF subfamily)
MAELQKQEFARLAALVAEQRDRAAFAKLFDYFAPRINAYLLRLNMDNGSAEEVTQEVMIVLWHKAGMFDPKKSSLPTWLFRIARNRRIDHLRRDKSDKLDPNEPMLLPSELEQPDAGIDAAKREQQVQAALASLPAEQVQLIRMAFFTGLSHSQIADEMDLPLGTVKSRIRLAFNRLRKVLEEDELVDVN